MTTQTQKPEFTIDEFAKTVFDADENSGLIPFWTPEEGDVIIGHITNIRQEQGDFGPRKVYTIYNELLQSYVRVTANSVLEGRFNDYGVRQGDRVGIKYLGKKKGKNKREYNLYAVFVDERARAGAPDGEPIVSEDDAEYNGRNDESPF